VQEVPATQTLAGVISFQILLITYLITYLLTPWYRILFEKLIVAELIKKYLAFFMEPEGSSPCSQKLATGSYPEPADLIAPTLQRLLIFQVNNFMFFFHSLGRAKKSVRVRGALKHFVTKYFFMVRGC
jgi:hypothetical protein